MPARVAVPRTNRVIGRIAFPPYSQQMAAAALAPVPESKLLAFPKKTITVRSSTRGAANDSISTDSIGLYRVGDLVGFGRDRPLLAHSLHHRAWLLGRGDRLFDPGARQFVPGPLARSGAGALLAMQPEIGRAHV